jgi:hypothetical protein
VSKERFARSGPASAACVASQMGDFRFDTSYSSIGEATPAFPIRNPSPPTPKGGVASSVRYDASRICSLPAGEERNIARLHFIRYMSHSRAGPTTPRRNAPKGTDSPS